MNELRCVVVTGSTGFIGRALCRHLLDAGVEVHGAARSRHAHDLLDRGLRPAPEVAAWLGGDDEAAPAALDLLARVDAVVHLAGDATYGDGAGYEAANVAPLRRLVDELSLLDAPPRVVLASSMGAQDRDLAEPLGRPVDEDSPAAPSSDYGRSKLAAEAVLSASGVPGAAARLGMVVGAEMRPDSHLAALCAQLRRAPTTLTRRLDGVLPLVHVDDAARALALLAADPAARGPHLVVADHVTVGEVAAHLAGRPPVRSSLTTGRLEPVRAQLPFVLRSVLLGELHLDASRLRARGWAPTVGWRAAVDEVDAAVDRRRRVAARPEGWTVVTGAGSGLGRAAAVRLAGLRDRLLLVDVDAAALAATAEALGPAAEVATLVVDLREEDAAARVIDAVAATGGHLSELFLCAGVGRKGSVGSVPSERELAAVDLNLRSRISMVVEALPELRARHQGRIVLVSSSSAFQPLPGFATYGAANAGLLAFGESLAGELVGSGVQVLTVCPGGMDTGFQAAAGVRRLEGERLLPPGEVVDRMLDALDRHRTPLVVGGRARAMDLVARVTPRPVQRRLWATLVERTR